MIPLTAPLSMVDTYGSDFSSVFTESEMCNLKRYLSGLLLHGNKTVEGINRLFVLDVMNQCTLNRFLTDSQFEVGALNKARVSWLQGCEQTAFKQGEGSKGTLILDDTLLSHYGSHFEKSAMLYDHVSKNYAWSHNLVNLHYSDDTTDYPIDFQLWEPANVPTVEQALLKIGFVIGEKKRALETDNPSKWRAYLLKEYQRKRAQPYKGGTRGAKGKSSSPIEVVYKSKLDYAQEMLRDFYATYRDSDLPIAFDTWYTTADMCQFIDGELGKSYVGTLAEKDNILFHSAAAAEKTTVTVLSCADFARQLVAEHQQASGQGLPPVFEKTGIHYKGKKETYYAYCKTHTTQSLGKQRLVISFSKEDLSDEPKFYVSNRLHWRSGGILRIRRHRWPIEVYHEEGKAEGLDKYQVRQFGAVKKHIACVCLTYSMLKRVQFDHAFLNKLQWNPQPADFTLPFLRRVMSANALLDFVKWVLDQSSTEVDMKPIIAQIAKAYA